MLAYQSTGGSYAMPERGAVCLRFVTTSFGLMP
jgi:hypothetical protein